MVPQLVGPPQLLYLPCMSDLICTLQCCSCLIVARRGGAGSPLPVDLRPSHLLSGAQVGTNLCLVINNQFVANNGGKVERYNTHCHADVSSLLTLYHIDYSLHV